LLRFLNTIFPNPPSSLLRSLPETRRKWRRDPQADVYRRLVLVGHSEGALVIRQAMIDACQRTTGQNPILNARLALFAPAHRGVLITGWVAAVLAVARAEHLASSALRASPAFAEMQDSEFIRGVQQSTEALLADYGRTAFRARALFGCAEKFVRVQVYPKDTREECAPDQDHVSVCKPRGEYLAPFDFIERVLAESNG
jgi:pimeloyl-ACP methyl ester carboxylesterase